MSEYLYKSKILSSSLVSGKLRDMVIAGEYDVEDGDIDWDITRLRTHISELVGIVIADGKQAEREEKVDLIISEIPNDADRLFLLGYIDHLIKRMSKCDGIANGSAMKNAGDTLSQLMKLKESLGKQDKLKRVSEMGENVIEDAFTKLGE